MPYATCRVLVDIGKGREDATGIYSDDGDQVVDVDRADISRFGLNRRVVKVIDNGETGVAARCFANERLEVSNFSMYAEDPLVCRRGWEDLHFGEMTRCKIYVDNCRRMMGSRTSRSFIPTTVRMYTPSSTLLPLTIVRVEKTPMTNGREVDLVRRPGVWRKGTSCAFDGCARPCDENKTAPILISP